MTSINEQAPIIIRECLGIRKSIADLAGIPVRPTPGAESMFLTYAKEAMGASRLAESEAREAITFSGTYVKHAITTEPCGGPRYGTADDKLQSAIRNLTCGYFNLLSAKSWICTSEASPSQISAVAGKFADLWLGEVFGMLDDMQVMELSAYRAMFQNEFIAAEVAKNGPGLIMAQSRTPEQEEEDARIENRRYWYAKLQIVNNIFENPTVTDEQKEALNDLTTYVHELELED